MIFLTELVAQYPNGQDVNFSSVTDPSPYEFTLSPPNVSMDKFLAMFQSEFRKLFPSEAVSVLDYSKFLQDLERSAGEYGSSKADGGYGGLLALMSRYRSGISGDTETLIPLSSSEKRGDFFGGVLSALSAEGVSHHEVSEDDVQKYVLFMLGLNDR